jgi:hypothetical protein
MVPCVYYSYIMSSIYIVKALYKHNKLYIDQATSCPKLVTTLNVQLVACGQGYRVMSPHNKYI